MTQIDPTELWEYAPTTGRSTIKSISLFKRISVHPAHAEVLRT